MYNLIRKHRDNKGFSLVELIVVVLIIAIIAVVLTPQVVKYVSGARTSTEKHQLAEVKSAAKAAVAKYSAENDLILEDGGTYYAWLDDNKRVSYDGPSDPNPGLADMISENIGSDSLGYNYSIVIQTDGTVTVTEM